MQSMDRNTIIGFVLLALLLFAYLYTSTKSSHELEAQKRRFEDSVARVVAIKQAAAVKKDTGVTAAAPKDTTINGKILNGEEKTLTVENQVFTIVFSSKGGEPKFVQLKNYNSAKGGPVQLE